MKENIRENVILADCKPEELQSFMKAINDCGIEIGCYSVISNFGREKVYSNFVRYLKYFVAPWNVFINREKYKCIVGWQQFYALIYCFWCQLFHVRKANRVIVVNFTYKDKAGFIGKIYKWFMKKCVCNQYLDYIHVLSNEYADIVAELFHIDRNKVFVVPFGVDDIMEKYGKTSLPDRAPSQKYALSIGRSNRDYDFLIDVWKDLDEDLVIISDEYKRNDLPSNVTLINNVSGEAQFPWLANCHFMIIPIKDVTVCSGDTVLLKGMSLAKAIFVTNPSTLAEMYVENNVNAVFISKDIENTKSKFVEYLTDEKLSKIGKNARETFLNKYSRYAMGKNLAKYINM